MKRRALVAFVLVALAELLQHAPALAQFRWCPRCAYGDPWTNCGGRR